MSGIRWIEFDVRDDERGKLVPLECNHNLPFDLHRAFYIYHVPASGTRGGHAHKRCHQVLVAVHGSLDVVVGATPYHLGNPARGLYIPPGLRIDMHNFTKECVLLVLASEYYDPNDYEY